MESGRDSNKIPIWGFNKHRCFFSLVWMGFDLHLQCVAVTTVCPLCSPERGLIIYAVTQNEHWNACYKHNTYRMGYKSLFCNGVFFPHRSGRDVGIAHAKRGSKRETRDVNFLRTSIDSNGKMLYQREICSIPSTHAIGNNSIVCWYECVVLYLTLLFCLNGEQIVPIYTRSPHWFFSVNFHLNAQQHTQYPSIYSSIHEAIA